MHAMSRGDSRRRGLTPDPSRRRRTPSSSNILPSPRRHIYALLDSIIYFTAATTNSHPLLLALLTPLFAALFFFISRPSFNSLRQIFRTRAFPLVFLLHSYFLLATFLAVQLIGPIRAIIALGAHPTIAKAFSDVRGFRRRTLLPCIVLVIFALACLAYDATGVQPGVKVRERMLRTHAGMAVHDQIHRLSEKIKVQSLRVPQVKEAVPLKEALKQEDPSMENRPQKERKPQAPPNPLKPETREKGKEQPPKPPTIDNSTELHNRTGRRLLSIVKSAELAEDKEEEAKRIEKPDPEIANVTEGIANSSNNSTANATNVETEKTSDNSTKLDAGHTEGRNETHNDTLIDVERPLLVTETEQHVSMVSAVVGILLALTAALSGHAASDAREKLVVEHGDWSIACISMFLHCSISIGLIIIPYEIIGKGTISHLSTELFQDIFFRTIVLSLCALIIPTLLQVYRLGLFHRSRSARSTKPATSASLSGILDSFVEGDIRFAATPSLYGVLLLIWGGVRMLGVSTNLNKISIASYTAAFLLVFTSIYVRGPVQRGSHRRSLNSGDLSALMGKARVGRVRSYLNSLGNALVASIGMLKDLFSHARSNKASGQILNFLILQTGMASFELLYATLTKATGLFSISADNFFCSVALAIGLSAIRVSARNPTSRFSYGYGRIESLCGFVNGIILIYVALLVVLEAVERLDDDNELAIGRAFSVCVIGVLGNVLGLYFFPPESRRENHNVQGIYLHIWANTLAFASMAVSTGITVANPAWRTADLIISACAGLGMILFAIPLLRRSGRLLLLEVPKEKEPSLLFTKRRLSEIGGVTDLEGFRVWSLTPNSLVASVHLKVRNDYDGSDAEVLFRARSVFAMIGIAANQCTIQINRYENSAPQSVVATQVSGAVRAETGINIDLLPPSSMSRI